MKVNPSGNHKNKQYHNWLIYKLLDRDFLKYSVYFRGVMYDLGSGDAPYKDFFNEYVDQYITVDWSDSQHNVNPSIIANLNELLPIDSETADTVVSISVLEHLSEPGIMLGEAFRILKPGGMIFIQIPWQWWIHEAPYDYFRYTPYGIKYLLEKAGFENVKVEAQSGFFTMWLIKVNYFTKRFVRGPKTLRNLLTFILVPFWFINQCIAPLLDHIDFNPEYESTGFIVLAEKVRKQ